MPPTPQTQSFHRWAFVPAALLVTLIGLQLVFLAGALDDPSFAIEEDYYAKATSWDAKMAQDRENARIGWDTTLQTHRRERATVVTIELNDSTGRPVQGARLDVTAFHNARADAKLDARLEERAPGAYSAELPAVRPGLWEFRLTATRGSQRFSKILRHDLGLEEAGRD